MTAFSQSAIPSVLFGHNSGVAAWALVSNHNSSESTQSGFDAVNFVDGYNLYLDTESRTVASGNARYDGALKFTFVTPMVNNRYKIFVNSYSTSGQLIHAVDSVTYPKTQHSFYIRSGVLNYSVLGVPTAAARTNNQISTVTLWSNATSSIGVVVMA
jgi:hypothetical protein